jgi:hypothetical protein
LNQKLSGKPGAVQPAYPLSAKGGGVETGEQLEGCLEQTTGAAVWQAASIFLEGRLWSPSYFAGSVGGASLSVLRQYIENQQRPL